jgi:hypothetical protein
MEAPCREGVALPLDIAEAEIICWSRMQTEAGQGLKAIFARKEAERAAGGGVFLWGVGNAPGATPGRLVRDGINPPVVFSVMKSRPKQADVGPTSVVAWRSYVTVDGRETSLPAHSLVTSRGPIGTALPSRHYALFCHSHAPLALGDFGGFDPGGFRNLGGTGAPVGASQVTALLRRSGPATGESYRINLAATLTGDLWVRLGDPVIMSSEKLEALHAFDSDASIEEWLDLVAFMRDGPAQADRRPRASCSLQPAFL